MGRNPTARRAATRFTSQPSHIEFTGGVPVATQRPASGIVAGVVQRSELNVIDVESAGATFLAAALDHHEKYFMHCVHDYDCPLCHLVCDMAEALNISLMDLKLAMAEQERPEFLC